MADNQKSRIPDNQNSRILWAYHVSEQKCHLSDPTASIRTHTDENGNMKLVVRNIHEDNIGKFEFIVNNDQNNFRIHLDRFTVQLENNSESLKFVGLYDIVHDSFMHSELDAFIEGKKFHSPFIPRYCNGQSFPDYINTLSSNIAFAHNTTGIAKKFSFVIKVSE